jgi:hypothetical protein
MRPRTAHQLRAGEGLERLLRHDQLRSLPAQPGQRPAGVPGLHHAEPCPGQGASAVAAALPVGIHEEDGELRFRHGASSLAALGADLTGRRH